MNISLFGIHGIPPGKHNVKDPRLDAADQLVEADKKTYAQVDLVGDDGALDANAILTTREALPDLLLKDLEVVDTRLARDPSAAEKAGLRNTQPQSQPDRG